MLRVLHHCLCGHGGTAWSKRLAQEAGTSCAPEGRQRATHTAMHIHTHVERCMHTCVVVYCVIVVVIVVVIVCGRALPSCQVEG